MLLLLGTGCTLQNKTLSTTNSTLVDSYWLLLSVEGEDLQGPTDTRTAYIRFEANENDINGFTGCNRFFGKYALTDSTVRLSNIGSTRMACPNNELESKFLSVLERATSYTTAGDVLTFYAAGKAIATFRAGQQQDQEILNRVNPPGNN